MSLLLLCISPLYSQSIFNKAVLNVEKEIKVDDNSYTFKKLPESKLILVETNAKKSKEYAQIQATSKENLPDITFYKMTDESGVLKAFLSTFSKPRLSELLPEKHLVISFYINTSTGAIENLSYLLNHGTLISPNELNILSSALKHNVYFKFNPNEVANRKIVNVIQNVKINKIVNKNL